MTSDEFEDAVHVELAAIGTMLVEKNRARGTNTEAVPEDTVRDLIGYLVILRIAQRDGAK